jgi:multidrug efflux pump subunit AcrB
MTTIEISIAATLLVSVLLAVVFPPMFKISLILLNKYDEEHKQKKKRKQNPRRI